ncbi:MAG TPA: VOC family protein [Bryobacteraceae bacterium]|nr:VOC family protein [Bryobacteraceae bacterium]
MQPTPYLFFDGQCEAAFKFYAQCFKSQIVASVKYGDRGSAESLGPAARDRIMHTAMKLGDAMLLASDCPPGQFEKPQGFAVSLDFPTAEEAEDVFKQLSVGANITMPMSETFWAVRFGMLTDQFGIPWMIGCNKPAPTA